MEGIEKNQTQNNSQTENVVSNETQNTNVVPKETKKKTRIRAGVALALAIIALVATIFSLSIWITSFADESAIGSIILLILVVGPCFIVSAICSLISLGGNLVVFFTGEKKPIIIVALVLAGIAMIGNIVMAINFFSLI